jgi:arylsulfatase A-like enzyme
MNKLDLIFTTFVLASLAALNAADSPTEPPRNMLFIITDQQTVGALSCAGNPYVKTPNLDRLAARGVRFEKSYCTYPLCSPSRGSLFTSRTPHELGIGFNGNKDSELSERDLKGKTMGEVFRAAGYETAYAGKWHLKVPFPSFKGQQIPGFTMLPLAGRDPGAIDHAKDGKGLTVDPNTADAAIKFLRQPQKKPFLLVVSLLNPHDICEYPECAALRALLPDDPAQLPPARPNLLDTEKLPSALQPAVSQKGDWAEQQWREYLWVYYRLCEAADTEAGRVLAALDRSGLTGNTVVVFTSDHGEMMGSHQMITKQKLYEESVAVPLFVVPPGGKARVDDQHLVSGLDVMPTLLDYAGIAAPASLQGKSLRPLVDGKEVPWREFVVSEVNGRGEARMVRTPRHKYIVFAEGENREQFFDMEKDPGELRNLIADPVLTTEVERHRRLLAQWRKDTHDEIGKRSPVQMSRKPIKPNKQ